MENNEEFNEIMNDEKSDIVVNPEDKIEKKKKRKFLTSVTAFVLILGVGIVGNWYYQNSDVSSTIQPLIDSATEKTLGKAELVDAQATTSVKAESDYFVNARMERQSARDSSLEKLQAIIESTEEKDEAKTIASENIARISNFISIENKIETLVCAKGVDNCIAIINEEGSRVDVIVDAKTLDDTLIMQIKDIATSQLDCGFENVSIIQSNNYK